MEEAEGCCSTFPLSWRSRFKWFTDNVDFLKRVGDGSFNNSTHLPNRYVVLCEYEGDLNAFSRVSDNELMLDRRKQPMAKLKLISKTYLL